MTDKIANERKLMKTSSKNLALVTGLTLGLAGLTGSIKADDAAPAPKTKTFTGVIVSLKPQDKTVAVQDFWTTKNFTAAGDCTVSLQAKEDASFADLHPGQKVAVTYQNADGVLVAHEVDQHDQVCTGQIKSIDPAHNKMVVKHGLYSTDFALPPDCEVTVRHGQLATPGNLQVGQTVSVTYNELGQKLSATKIAQTSSTFVGTVQALDANTRTIQAKSLMSDRSFHLADGCRIVTANDTDASLKDLHIGDKVAVNYENVDGVMVANWVGQNANATDSANSQTARVSPDLP